MFLFYQKIKMNIRYYSTYNEKQVNGIFFINFLCYRETFSITNITTLMNDIKFLYKFQYPKPNYNNQELHC